MSSKRYTEEFKIEAIRQVVDRGYSIAEVADGLGTTTHSLYAWKKKYGLDSAEHLEKTETDQGIRRLKKELRRVTDECDILKKSRAVLRQPVRMRYTFIRTNSTVWPVRWLCRLLEVHPSGYYA